MEEVKVDSLVKGAFAGLIGGLVGAFVMTEFQTFLSAFSKNGNGSENSEPSTVKAARQISEAVFDHKLTKTEKAPAGEAVHYAMGGTTGLIYGISAEIAPLAAAGGGMPFGAAVWLVADDIVVPALGLSKPATEYPVSTHAYALSSHLVYGFATDIVRRAVRGVL